jgi:hypothetical protein
MIRVLRFDSWQRLEIFFFTTVSRMALGPTQHPTQWVQGAVSLGVKQPGCKADHSPPSNAKVKECVELYLHFPICFQGMMISFKKKKERKKAQGKLYLYLLPPFYIKRCLVHNTVNWHHTCMQECFWYKGQHSATLFSAMS